MNLRLARAVVGLAVFLCALFAQGAQSDTPDQVTPQSSANQPWSEAQLEQLLAPIALYSDPLLAQIMMAATYPLEIVQADRWLQDPANAALKGDQLAAALETQTWDPSVKSLVPFPQILRMMDSNLSWTEQLGDAFLVAQPEAMDAIQQLRNKATVSGALQSTPQQAVSVSGSVITIEPAVADVVYVPVYDPLVAYGPWPYAAYPPYYFPDAWGVVPVGYFGFGWVGIGINFSFWGWCGWEWGRHGIYVNGGRFNGGNPPKRGPPPRIGPWRHDPEHRGGVPYPDNATRARFLNGGVSAGKNFRGYPVEPPVGSAGRPPLGRAVPVAPPGFAPFGRGSEVRNESDRGRASRESAPGTRGTPANGGRKP
jgi:hypothetical protein